MLNILRMGPVMPVVVIDDAAQAVPLARGLLAGGIRVVEITLRTTAALAAIRAVAQEVPEITVGAGTILHGGDLARARDAGARFGVSPGATPELLHAARGFPFLPGVVTPSEIMAAQAAGYSSLKFFPAAPAGGAAALKALAAVFPQVSFCPTGGITAASAPDYLALPNVICVGGSWLTPPALVRAGDWDGVTRLARACATLGKNPGAAARLPPRPAARA